MERAPGVPEGSKGKRQMASKDDHNQDDRLFGDGPISGDGWSASDLSSADRAALIRAAADGELTDAQASKLADFDGSARSRIAFEQGLRGAVASAMGGVETPAGLRDRVLATARAASDEDRLAENLESRSVETRDRSFWNGQGRLVGAIAAVLMLAVGAFFVTQMAPSGFGGGADGTAYRTSLARFVTAEHERTLDESSAHKKHVFTNVNDAVEKTGSDLGAAPSVPPCGGQTKFRGAAPCHLPGKGPSAHFQFAVEAGEGAEPRTVSLFVRKDGGELPIEEGRAYRVNTEACDVEGVAIYVWRARGLMYTFVSSGAHGSICNLMLKDLGIAEPKPGESI